MRPAYPQRSWLLCALRSGRIASWTSQTSLRHGSPRKGRLISASVSTDLMLVPSFWMGPKVSMLIYVLVLDTIKFCGLWPFHLMSRCGMVVRVTLCHQQFWHMSSLVPGMTSLGHWILTNMQLLWNRCPRRPCWSRQSVIPIMSQLARNHEITVLMLTTHRSVTMLHIWFRMQHRVQVISPFMICILHGTFTYELNGGSMRLRNMEENALWRSKHGISLT